MATSVFGAYGDSQPQQLHSQRYDGPHHTSTTPMQQRYSADGGESEHSRYGSSSTLHASRSMPDMLPSGRDYPTARSERGVPHGRRSRKQSSTRPSPSFVAKGLLNLDNLQVKKSKTQPEWAKWSSNEGRDGWIPEPRFKTRSELKKHHAEKLMPDQTFDVDGDGQVSAQDLALAARYDANRDGKLQPEELRDLRLGVVSQALDNISRRLKAGQMYARNPAVVRAVQEFSNVDEAVDHPDFTRKLEKLRACMNPSFEGRSSLNVREIMRQPRASHARHPERVPATPHYLREARRSAAKAVHAAHNSSTPVGPTPRWISQRSAMQEHQQAERDDLSQCESDLDTVPQLSPHTTGCKTRSELLGTRKDEATRLATHYLDYDNFGGDFHFPNAQREVRKRQVAAATAVATNVSGTDTAASRDNSTERGRRGGRTQGQSRAGEWRTASFDPAHGPPPSTPYSSRLQGKSATKQERQQHVVGGGGKLKTLRSRPRVQGCGTHIQISAQPDAEASVQGAKAGRDGPMFQGGRLPTPLYNSTSVATFATPLEGQRTPGGRIV